MAITTSLSSELWIDLNRDIITALLTFKAKKVWNLF